MNDTSFENFVLLWVFAEKPFFKITLGKTIIVRQERFNAPGPLIAIYNSRNSIG